MNKLGIREIDLEQKNLLVILVVLGLVIMIMGIFVVPRQISYDPRPGLKPQLLLDLDPDSNELSLFAEGITSDEDGNLYIGDNTGKISRIDPGTGKMEVVGKVVADGEGVGLFGIKFDFAKYSEEIGGYAGELEDKRTSFQVSLIF